MNKLDKAMSTILDIMQKYNVEIKLTVQDQIGGKYLVVEMSNSGIYQVRQSFTFKPDEEEETFYLLCPYFEEQLEDMAKLLVGKEVR